MNWTPKKLKSPLHNYAPKTWWWNNFFFAHLTPPEKSLLKFILILCIKTSNYIVLFGGGTLYDFLAFICWAQFKINSSCMCNRAPNIKDIAFPVPHSLAISCKPICFGTDFRKNLTIKSVLSQCTILQPITNKYLCSLANSVNCTVFQHLWKINEMNFH